VGWIISRNRCRIIASSVFYRPGGGVARCGGRGPRGGRRLGPRASGTPPRVRRCAALRPRHPPSSAHAVGPRLNAVRLRLRVAPPPEGGVVEPIRWLGDNRQPFYSPMTHPSLVAAPAPATPPLRRLNPAAAAAGVVSRASVNDHPPAPSPVDPLLVAPYPPVPSPIPIPVCTLGASCDSGACARGTVGRGGGSNRGGRSRFTKKIP